MFPMKSLSNSTAVAARTFTPRNHHDMGRSTERTSGPHSLTSCSSFIRPLSPRKAVRLSLAQQVPEGEKLVRGGVGGGPGRSRTSLPRKASERQSALLAQHSRPIVIDRGYMGSSSMKLPSCNGGRRLSEIGTYLVVSVTISTQRPPPPGRLCVWKHLRNVHDLCARLQSLDGGLPSGFSDPDFVGFVCGVILKYSRVFTSTQA